MKEEILKRIEYLRSQSDGFSKGLMRWSGLHVTYKNKIYHISEVTPEMMRESNDEGLLVLFEKILKRFYSQM